MADAKKRRLQGVARSAMSLREMRRVLAALEMETPSHGGAQKEVNDALDIHTPFGKLLQTATLPLTDGGQHTFHYIEPAGLLFHLCSVSRAFAGHIENCLADGPAGVLLYTDETCPGNQLHPDTPRQVMCCYWSLLQLPSWLRARKFGWFVFTVIKNSVLDRVLGGCSQLCLVMLRIFFAGTVRLHSFLVGMRLPRGPGGDLFVFKARLCSFVQDEKAHKCTWSVKGAGGYKFCCYCMNVLRTDPDKVPPGFHHLSEAKPEHFQRHTAQTWKDSIRLLDGSLGTDRQDELEIVLGLTYDAHGLLWDPWARERFNPADHVFWDIQHVLLGSGGVAQFHANHFIRECSRHQIHGTRLSPELIDTYASMVEVPSRLKDKRLSKTFFADRTVQKDGAHIKAFASEMLMALPMLVLFCDLVLVPAGIMLEHVRGLKLMALITKMLFAHEPAKHLATLRLLVDEHFDVYGSLYGHCVASKPKLHYLFHVLDNLAAHGQLVTCFACERFHKCVNKFGRGSAGPKLGDIVLKRVLLEHLDHASSNSFAKEEYLCDDRGYIIDGAVVPEWNELLMSLAMRAHPNTNDVAVAQSFVAKGGKYSNGDTVEYSDDAKNLKVGIVMCGAMARDMLRRPLKLFVLITTCTSVRESVWARGEDLAFAAAGDVGNSLMYAQVGDGRRTLMTVGH